MGLLNNHVVDMYIEKMNVMDLMAEKVTSASDRMRKECKAVGDHMCLLACEELTDQMRRIKA